MIFTQFPFIGGSEAENRNLTEGKMNMKLNIETFIEELRTTIPWDNVSSYIESVEEANRLLQQPDLKRNGRAEKVDIMDSEDFYVVDVAKNKDTELLGYLE